MTKTEANDILTAMTQSMMDYNRTELGIRSMPLVAYTTCKNTFEILSKDVENPSADWAARTVRSETIVLNPAAYAAMVTLAGEQKVIKLMIRAMMNVTGKTWREVHAIVTAQLQAAA
jgi:hypothetical protein